MGVVVSLVAAAGPLGFKPPDMVAEFDAGREPGLGEFGEVSVDRGPVEAEVVEGVRHFGVCQRPHCHLEVPHHGHAGGGAPQACPADAVPHSVVSKRFFTTHM